MYFLIFHRFTRLYFLSMHGVLSVFIYLSVFLLQRFQRGDVLLAVVCAFLVAACQSHLFIDLHFIILYIQIFVYSLIV